MRWRRRLQAGDLTVGDVGLFAAYATMIAELPKWVGRYLVYQRQADVSVDRLAVLLPAPDRRAVVAPTQMYIRHGPPPFGPTDATDAGATDRAAFEELAIDGLTVRHAASGRGIRGVDLLVRRGELVVVTGPVGSGKSTLLRAVLGLVGADAGTIRWNGTPVDDPSTCPRVPPICPRCPACSASRWSTRSCSVRPAKGWSMLCGSRAWTRTWPACPTEPTP